jgi:hypothetical protein
VLGANKGGGKETVEEWSGGDLCSECVQSWMCSSFQICSQPLQIGTHLHPHSPVFANYRCASLQLQKLASLTLRPSYSASLLSSSASRPSCCSVRILSDKGDEMKDRLITTVAKLNGRTLWEALIIICDSSWRPPQLYSFPGYLPRDPQSPLLQDGCKVILGRRRGFNPQPFAWQLGALPHLVQC